MRGIKFLSSIILMVISIVSFSQELEMSNVDKRMLPKYGLLPKTPKEIESDNKFIKAIMDMEEYSGGIMDIHMMLR